MGSLLENVEKDLAQLEETLLLELRKLRKQNTQEIYSSIDAEHRLEIKLTVDSLQQSLDNSGDLSNLSLKTDQHENLETRIDVIKKLLSKKIPTAFIESSHREVKQSRDMLARKVAASRKTSEPPPKPKGFLDRLFDRSKTDGEDARNPARITREEESALADESGQKNTGVFSAARELAILCEQVLLHNEEGKSIEQVVKERAQFDSRELSRAHTEVKPGLAQSPDEIRRKLQGRTHQGGASTFTSRDIDSPYKSNPPRKPEGKQELAQSPDEIRRKLASRQAGDAGKAVFGARDVESESEKNREAAPAPSKKTEQPARPSGKATFESRDLSEPKR